MIFKIYVEYKVNKAYDVKDKSKKGDSFMQIIILVLVFMMVFAIQYRITRYYYYQCNNCGEKFSLSVWMAVLSVHMMGEKYVKCPKCEKWCWASLVPKE